MDPQLGAAILAAPVGWAALFLVFRPELAPLWLLEYPWVYLKLACLFPVLEELVFRGLVQGAIARVVLKRWGILTASNALTSLVFSATHILVHGTLQAGSVILPSLVFGYFREKHATLVTPVALHVFYNAGFFLVFPQGS